MTSIALDLPSGRSCTIYKPIKSSPEAVPTASNDLKDVKSEEITITTKENETIKAYLSVPDVETTPTTGIVMICDIFGCDSGPNREIADLFAKNSIPTIIPDIFRGNPWPEKPLDDTFAPWLETHPFDRILADTAAAAAALRERGYAKSLGLIGFCLGGGRVLDEISLGEAGLNPDAAVSFYGTRFDGDKVGGQSKCPLMYIIGDADPLIPMPSVESLRTTLETNSIMSDAEVIIIKGAGHAFVHRPKTDDDNSDQTTIFSKAIGWMNKYLVST